jgi:hypothetical protein
VAFCLDGGNIKWYILTEVFNGQNMQLKNSLSWNPNALRLICWTIFIPSGNPFSAYVSGYLIRQLKQYQQRTQKRGDSFLHLKKLTSNFDGSAKTPGLEKRQLGGAWQICLFQLEISFLLRIFPNKTAFF